MNLWRLASLVARRAPVLVVVAALAGCALNDGGLGHDRDAGAGDAGGTGRAGTGGCGTCEPCFKCVNEACEPDPSAAWIVNCDSATIAPLKPSGLVWDS